MRRVILAAAAALLLPVLAAAVDAPHDSTFSDGKCENCHTLFTPSASGTPDYSTGCVSCHNTKASVQNGFPWQTGDQAIPGVTGSQHSWSGLATNPSFSATDPAIFAMAQRLVDGKLQCVVCHDAHHAAPGNAPNSRQTSIAIGTATARTSGTGTGFMTLVAAGSNPGGFRVRIQTVAGTTGTFIISRDFGAAAPTWLNWTGSAWALGTVAGAGKPYTNGTAVTLDDTTFQVSFSGTNVVGDSWDFWSTFPFLRAGNVADAMCAICHGARVVDHTGSGGLDGVLRPNGTRLFSHPVNVTLNVNGRGTDRAAPLDANGASQATGDGNTSNNLVLDGGTTVTCSTCHAIHNADSNSLTQDAR